MVWKPFSTNSAFISQMIVAKPACAATWAITLQILYQYCQDKLSQVTPLELSSCIMPYITAFSRNKKNLTDYELLIFLCYLNNRWCNNFTNGCVNSDDKMHEKDLANAKSIDLYSKYYGAVLLQAHWSCINIKPKLSPEKCQSSSPIFHQTDLPTLDLTKI